MAADGTQIKQEIDANLSNKGYRGVRVFNVVTALKDVVDWVTGAVNGNLSTWLRISDSQPGGTNADFVYRTGKVEFRGGAALLTTQGNANPLATQVFGSTAGLEVRSGTQNGPAFIDFHVPGLAIHQLGVDIDGVLKIHPWSSTSSHEVVANGLTNRIITTNVLSNKKLSLYDFNNNDHQFYGLGVQGGTFRYQVPTDTDAHIFYSGSSPITSTELMRIQGDGRVGIGAIPAPNTTLDVAEGWANFHGNVGGMHPGNGIGINLGWNYSGGQAENSIVFGIKEFPGSCLNILTWDGVAPSEKMRIDASGKVGIGTTGPSSRLQVNGSAGHNQFRLEKSYTPTNSADANGLAGDIAWSDSYFYVKTTAGWKRSALTTF